MTAHSNPEDANPRHADEPTPAGAVEAPAPATPEPPTFRLGWRPRRWKGRILDHHQALVDLQWQTKRAVLQPRLASLSDRDRAAVEAACKRSVLVAARYEQVAPIIGSIVGAALIWAVGLVFLGATAWPLSGPWWEYVLAAVVGGIVFIVMAML